MAHGAGKTVRNVTCVMTSDGLKVVDNFKGRYLLHIYENNMECQNNYDSVAREASLEF